MNSEQLIPVQQICVYHHVEPTFISLLQEQGLIAVVTQEEEQYVPGEQMRDLERMIRLHYELEINMEGLDAVVHLLHKMNEMQAEMRALKNRLRLYENEGDSKE